MPPSQAAIYARVLSAHPAHAQTIARQGAALQDRVTAAGLVVPAALQGLDDGDSGATLLRPAPERWRDAAAAAGRERLDGHAPDRLTRTYAYHVVRVEAGRRLGVEIVFLHRARGRSPEEA